MNFCGRMDWFLDFWGVFEFKLLNLRPFSHFCEDSPRIYIFFWTNLLPTLINTLDDLCQTTHLPHKVDLSKVKYPSYPFQKIPPKQSKMTFKISLIKFYVKTIFKGQYSDYYKKIRILPLATPA